MVALFHVDVVGTGYNVSGIMINVSLSILMQFLTWRFLAKSLESATGKKFSFFTAFHLITLSEREVERTLIISLMH
jgi:hypothetical protein